MPRYNYQPFPYQRPTGLDVEEPRHQIVIVGAGPIGLAMAIDLAQRGIASVVLDDNNVVSVGSRAICWAKRTLEIFDRLGVGERMLEKGVVWKVGRLFNGDTQIYEFDLLPETGHKYPAFINLQQYYVEQYLVERAQDFPDLIDLRFKNKLVDHVDTGAFIKLEIETPDGPYSLETRYLLACDGAGSPTRQRMGLAFDGQIFDEHFLIADVEMETSPFETETPERWFWFNPPFHQGQSALLHQQPDNIYRIDLQLDPDANPEEEASEEKVLPRIKAIMGDKPFKLDWMSVYKFRCAALQKFVHGNVIFVGDSAHVVSPFGARGGNGGIHDVDNLGWKLAYILKGLSPESLLDSYDEERGYGATENIANSARATTFMTPKNASEMRFREAVLTLAGDAPFAQKLINSGRLSLPCSLAGMSLQTEGKTKDIKGAIIPGMAIPDAPLAGGHWLIELLNKQFCLIGIGNIALPEIAGLERIGISQMSQDYSCFEDSEGLVAARYGTDIAYLIRPDGHCAALFTRDTISEVAAAFSTAKGY